MGIGVIKAFFHLSGNWFSSKDVFIMLVRTVVIRGKNKSIVEMFMPSIPLDFDLIDLQFLLLLQKLAGKRICGYKDLFFYKDC